MTAAISGSSKSFLHAFKHPFLQLVLVNHGRRRVAMRKDFIMDEDDKDGSTPLLRPVRSWDTDRSRSRSDESQREGEGATASLTPTAMVRNTITSPSGW